MKKLTITLLLCLCLTGQLFAQMSREDLEVALKYFPAGICGSIAHVDDAALAESKIFNKYRGAFSVKATGIPSWKFSPQPESGCSIQIKGRQHPFEEIFRRLPCVRGI